MEEVETGKELHGTISVGHFSQMSIQYNPLQRREPSLKYLPLELGSTEKSKEKPNITPIASENGGWRKVGSCTKNGLSDK